MVLSDAEFVRMAQGGDVASLGILLERHRAPLHAMALQILHRGPEAHDAVQDAFLVALRRINQIREPEAVGGWLRMVLRNVCLMRLREARENIQFDELFQYVGCSLEPSVEEYIDSLALREWVWTALSELSEDLRVTAMLRYFGSYTSYQEISIILGVPVGTVRSRLSRAKVTLADALLKTAEQEHDEARRITESQTRFFTEAFDQGNRNQDHKMYASACSDDLEMVLPDGIVLCGIGTFIQGMEEDSEAGVKLHATSVLASKDVTVVEADLENPPDDPFHCPPATSMVCFYRDGRIHRMRPYYAPHPKSQHEYR